MLSTYQQISAHPEQLKRAHGAVTVQDNRDDWRATLQRRIQDQISPPVVLTFWERSVARLQRWWWSIRPPF